MRSPYSIADWPDECNKSPKKFSRERRSLAVGSQPASQDASSPNIATGASRRLEARAVNPETASKVGSAPCDLQCEPEVRDRARTTKDVPTRSSVCKTSPPLHQNGNINTRIIYISPLIPRRLATSTSLGYTGSRSLIRAPSPPASPRQVLSAFPAALPTSPAAPRPPRHSRPTHKAALAEMEAPGARLPRATAPAGAGAAAAAGAAQVLHESPASLSGRARAARRSRASAGHSHHRFPRFRDDGQQRGAFWAARRRSQPLSDPGHQRFKNWGKSQTGTPAPPVFW
jgi:hypothetical protein